MTRKDEIKEFAKKLYELEKQYGVVVLSDNYFTDCIIADSKNEKGFSYHYNKGNIDLDHNTFFDGEDEE